MNRKQRLAVLAKGLALIAQNLATEPELTLNEGKVMFGEDQVGIIRKTENVFQFVPTEGFDLKALGVAEIVGKSAEEVFQKLQQLLAEMG